MQDKQETTQALRQTDELIQKLRYFVKGQLDEEVLPSDVSYALAYVATELGLFLAPEPVDVIPVVMGAIAQAVLTQQKSESDEQEEKETLKNTVISETMH